MAENKKLDPKNIQVSEGLLQKVLDDKTVNLIEKNSKKLSKSLDQVGDSLDSFSGKDFEKATGVGEIVEGLSQTRKIKSATTNIKTLGDSLDKFQDKDFSGASGVGDIVEGLSNKFKVVSAVENIKLLGSSLTQFQDKDYSNATGVGDIIEGLSNPFKVVLAKANITMLGKTLDKFQGKDYSNAVGVKDIIDGLWNPFKVDLAISNIQSLGDTLKVFEEKDYSGAVGVKDIIDGLYKRRKVKRAVRNIKEFGKDITKFGKSSLDGANDIVSLIETLSSPLKIMKAKLGLKLISGLSNNVPKMGSKQDVLGDTAALEEQQRESNIVQKINDVYTEVKQNQTLLRQIKGDEGLPTTQPSGMPGDVKEDEEGFSLLGNLGLITTALAGALGIYLAKEHPELARGFRFVVSAGRTLARHVDDIAKWAPKITENLTKWGGDILTWGSKLWKVIQGGLSNIPIVGKLFTTVGDDLAVKAGSKVAAKASGKVGGKILKTILKKLPIVGLASGLYFAYDRAMSGDYVGATGELVSGVASMFPLVGTALSALIDAGLLARDAEMTPTERSDQSFADAGLALLKMIVKPYKIMGSAFATSFGHVQKGEYKDAGMAILDGIGEAAKASPIGRLVGGIATLFSGDNEPEVTNLKPTKSKVTPEGIKKQVDEQYQDSDSQIAARADSASGVSEEINLGMYEKFNTLTEQIKSLAGLVVASKGDTGDKPVIKTDSSTPTTGSAQQIYYQLMHQY